MYNDTVQFEIVRRCGSIGKEKNGWTRELNLERGSQPHDKRHHIII